MCFWLKQQYILYSKCQIISHNDDAYRSERVSGSFRYQPNVERTSVASVAQQSMAFHKAADVAVVSCLCWRSIERIRRFVRTVAGMKTVIAGLRTHYRTMKDYRTELCSNDHNHILSLAQHPNHSNNIKLTVDSLHLIISSKCIRDDIIFIIITSFQITENDTYACMRMSIL